MQYLVDGLERLNDDEYTIGILEDEIDRLWQKLKGTQIINNGDGTFSYPEGSIGEQILQQIIDAVNAGFRITANDGTPIPNPLDAFGIIDIQTPYHGTLRVYGTVT